ncbi:unnamed protein product [Effrenium voratum]|nr:unnamed protein product [Effrenium voratum]
MNQLMLGARILQSGGVSHEQEASGLQAMWKDLLNANSRLCRLCLLLQGATFVLALLSSELSELFSLVTVLLAHTLLRRAALSIMGKRLSMHVLMLVVLLGAMYLGQFTEAATVAFLVNAAEWIVGKSQVAVEEELEKSLVGTATHATLLGQNRQGVSVKIEDLKPKDVVLLKAGSTVPCDGRVLRCEACQVNEAAVTGEALPVEKQLKSQLFSALDTFARISRLGVDKTGTLTKGAFELAQVVMMPGHENKQDLLRLLAALESQDSHPLANSLVRSYVGCAASFVSSAALPKVERFTRVESAGVWGIVEGTVVGAGSRRFLESMAIDLPQEAEDILQEWEQSGSVFTTVFMTLEDEVVLVLRLEDEVREDAFGALRSLELLGVSVAMLTGDERRAAEAVSSALGIKESLAKLTPGEKERWIHGDAEEGLAQPLLKAQAPTAMLGDGLNDAPALAAADVGVAIAQGLQLPCDAADVVIGSGGQMLQRFVQALHFARRCKDLIRQNLAIAVLVKFSALALAATGHLYLTLGVLSDTGCLLLLSDLSPGVMGMKTGSLGPKRQIYDKTFYLVELRKRCQAPPAGGAEFDICCSAKLNSIGRSKVAGIYGAWQLLAKAAMSEGTSPYVFLFYRCFLGSVIMILTCFIPALRPAPDLPFDPVRAVAQSLQLDGGKFFLLAVLIGMNTLGGLLAVSRLPAIVCAIMQPSMPVIAVIISCSSGVEPWSSGKVLCVLVSAAGAVIVVSHGHDLPSHLSSMLGWFFLFVNVTTGAAYSVFQKHTGLLQKYSPMFVAGVSFLLAGCALLPAALADVDTSHSFRPLSLLALAYVVVFGTAYNYSIGAWANKVTRPSFVTAFHTLQPVATSLLNYLLFGVSLTAGQAFGGATIIVGLLANVMELTDEVKRLNQEINDIQQDNNVYASLEKRYDTLVKTVRSLEGDLADHNLATDKQRTDTRPEEVHHMYTLMKSQNEQQRADVDQIFLEKRSHEEEIGRMEQEIGAIARAAEERLNELHPDQRREYEDLREESKRLSTDLADARDELDQVSGRLNALESRLRSDPLRTRHRQLNQARKELETQLLSLRQEVQQGSMSIPEQREILLSKVKNDNQEIVATEKSNSEMKLEMERLRAQIREVQADVEEKKEESSDQQKYEILFTKDQEMTAFIEGFAEAKAEEEKKIKEKQESIERLQLIISKSLELPPDVTPESHLRDMEDELDFKKAQLQNSETTQSRLEAELAKREGELEKIESLDVKISLELSQVEEKMRQYEKEIAERYDKIDDMKAQGALESQKLEDSKKGLEEMGLLAQAKCEASLFVKFSMSMRLIAFALALKTAWCTRHDRHDRLDTEGKAKNYDQCVSATPGWTAWEDTSDVTAVRCLLYPDDGMIVEKEEVGDMYAAFDPETWSASECERMYASNVLSSRGAEWKCRVITKDDVPMCHCNRKNDSGNRESDCPTTSGNWRCSAQRAKTGLCPDNRCTCVNSDTAKEVASRKTEAEVQRMFHSSFSPFFDNWQEMMMARKEAGMGGHNFY